VQQYILAENNYSAFKMQHLAPLHHQILCEMNDPIESFKDERFICNGVEYHHEVSSDGSVSIRRIAKDKVQEILSSSELIEFFNLDFVSIKWISISPSNRKLLAIIQIEPSTEKFELVVKNLEKMEMERERIRNVHGGEWFSDDVLYYTKINDKLVVDQVWRMEVGGRNELIYQETDPEFTIDVTRTKDLVKIR
jgi:protease II